MSSIGKRIKELREAKAISREQLASRAEMSYSQLQRIEQGKHKPRVSTQHMIAKALNVPVAELHSNEPATGTPTTNERFDSVELRLRAVEAALWQQQAA